MPIYWQHLVEVDACEECGDAPAVIEGRCEACEEARQEDAQERDVERFYGASTPQTERERRAVEFARMWLTTAYRGKR